MADDAAAAAYRRYQEEEYERRILQQIRERPSNIMRIRTFEEAKDRWRAADGTSEGITERIDNEAQGVLRKHVLSLNRIRREEVEAMRGQSTAPPIKRWMRNGVNRVALSRVRPRRRSNDPECPVCLELLRGDMVVAPCGHAFCDDCYAGYVGNKVDEGPGCVGMRCPDAGCDVAVPPRLLAACLDDARAAKLGRCRLEEGWCLLQVTSSEFSIFLRGRAPPS